MRIGLNEIHERRHRAIIDRHQLIDLVARAVLEEAGLEPNQKNLKISVKFEAVEEGSPAYKVGTKAVVDIVEDLSSQALNQPQEHV